VEPVGFTFGARRGALMGRFEPTNGAE